MQNLYSFLCLLAVALAMPPQTEDGFQDAQEEHEHGGRIVGGKSTTIDKFPYQISLQVNGRHECAGSIISPEWVLTAAHCVVNSTSKFSVRAGTSTRNSGGSIYDVAKIIRHSSYNSSTYDYDIAVIRISGNFRFGRDLQPVELAYSAPVSGTNTVVTGWGLTSENGTGASILQYVHVPVVPNSVCTHYYRHIRLITDRMMCAGFITGRKGPCNEDSGGPLVSGGVQVGIVSWGNGCASSYPGVYTNVANLRSWINKHTGV